mmetsp:Transcript_37721/g.61417  ORF Transcript_37721/g.61417 Transcript_37721/m.61417 type:complete len:207 (+) Transcript_37721:5119-5739(+)
MYILSQRVRFRAHDIIARELVWSPNASEPPRPNQDHVFDHHQFHEQVTKFEGERYTLSAPLVPVPLWPQHKPAPFSACVPLPICTVDCSKPQLDSLLFVSSFPVAWQHFLYLHHPPQPAVPASCTAVAMIYSTLSSCSLHHHSHEAQQRRPHSSPRLQPAFESPQPTSHSMPAVYSRVCKKRARSRPPRRLGGPLSGLYGRHRGRH